jgi:hypothetical protein
MRMNNPYSFMNYMGEIMLIDSMCFLCDSMCPMWLLIENNTQLATIPGRGVHLHGAIEE